jgi:hypothetical protein
LFAETPVNPFTQRYLSAAVLGEKKGEEERKRFASLSLSFRSPAEGA